MLRSHKLRTSAAVVLFAACLLSVPRVGVAAEEWLQLKHDAGHCGNVPDRTLASSLGLIGAVPLTDAVLTAPVVVDGRVYVVDAAGVAFCLDAATGKLLWEAPFSGSPSWNRQLPPIVVGDLAVYAFSTGAYGPARTENKMQWLFGHGSRSFPKDQKALVRACDLDTGKEVWTQDFSQYGYGGDDAGLCLMDGTLYYSCYFGGSAKRTAEGQAGVTAAIEPTTGRVLWSTTKYAVHSGCTISAKDGRLYLGGYAAAKTDRRCHVWCLDARDGSLIWESEPLVQAIHDVTVCPTFLFTCGQSKDGYLIDKETGKILTTLAKAYRCTRYTFSNPFLLGVNMDVVDSSNGQLISSGPSIDPNACVGSMVSNGRIFHTSQGGGLQVSKVYGPEAAMFQSSWHVDLAP